MILMPIPTIDDTWMEFNLLKRFWQDDGSFMYVEDITCTTRDAFFNFILVLAC
jgi:hypothetical protein